jgi:hypothetical protein
MILMLGMPVPFVHVVHMITVRHGDMSAARAMHMIMPRVLLVLDRFALVEMTVVPDVQMPVMDVVDVAAVRDRDMATALTVPVIVPGVLPVFG